VIPRMGPMGLMGHGRSRFVGRRWVANRKNGKPRTVNPLGRMKAAVDGESEAVQHASRIAEKKTDDTRDVFALGESA
jgi:hypothetical protein